MNNKLKFSQEELVILGKELVSFFYNEIEEDSNPSNMHVDSQIWIGEELFSEKYVLSERITTVSNLLRKIASQIEDDRLSTALCEEASAYETEYLTEKKEF